MLYLLMSIQWSVNRLLVVCSPFPVRNKNAYLSSRILLSITAAGQWLLSLEIQMRITVMGKAWLSQLQ